MSFHVSFTNIVTNLIAISVFVCLSTSSCTTTTKPESQSKAKTKKVATAKPRETQPETSQVPQVAVAPATPEPTPPPPSTPVVTPVATPEVETCIVLKGFSGDSPVYVPAAKVFVTKVTKPCKTADGQPGFERNASFLAMGFPCTGSDGRIDWKGTNYLAPKMVSFLTDTSCPMAPVSQEILRETLIRELGGTKEMTVLAFNPFMIQYWEIPEYAEADTSFHVELRTNKGLSQGWGSLQKKQPLKAVVIGRENAWVQVNHFYQAEIEITETNRNRFRMQVVQAKVLNDDELAAYKSKCESLRPERQCGNVFK